ncbi:MAG: two-component regulator propeller domain-containing protein [Flavobacteriaceae bacterium]|nr:two-component regulator propeller domain-containing protein [Flavobacteriaceae bacterium]
MIFRKIVYIFITCLCPIFFCFSQEGTRFHNLIELPGENDQAEVFSVIQSKDGYLWFGTSRGLYRYDGVDFKIFKSKRRSNTALLDDHISSLLEDRNGTIWIGSSFAGVSSLNTKTGEFSHFKLLDSTNNVKPNSVAAIFEDSKGTIWIGTQGTGLGKYLPETNSFKYYLFDQDNKNSITQDYVTAIIEDEQGYLWLGLNGQGIDRFDPLTEKFKNFSISELANQTANFRNNVVRDLYDDKQGTIWLATYGGFNSFNKKSGKFTHFDSDNSSFLKSNSLNSIVAKDTILYVTSYDGYIYEYDLKKEEFSQVKTIPYNIRTSKLDSDDSLWLGLTDGKILMISKRDEFPFFKVSDSIKVACMLKTSKRDYFGTIPDGLYLGDHHQLAKKSELALSDNSIISITAGPENTIWIGTSNGGINIYDPASEKITIARHIPGNEKSLRHDTTLKIYKDQFNDMWVGTLHGLSHWIPDKKIFHNRGRTAFYDMLRLSEEELFCATAFGLAIINPITNEFSMKQASFEKQENTLLHNQVNTLFAVNKDSIFIGTKAGLNLFIKNQDKILDVHSLINLPYVEIKDIVQDHHRNFWMLTSDGLLQIDLKRKNYKFYDKTNGIDYNREWNTSLQFDNETNKLVIGGNGGYYEFIPQPLEYERTPIRIAISDVKVFNKPLGKKYATQLQGKKELELPYDENMVTLSFSGINFKNPKSVNYAYLLEGLHNEWIFTKERYATFTNLDPGEYIFKVKATNADGIWNETPEVLAFQISPPFWATWWAYVIYALFVATLAYLIITAFIKRERLKSNLKLEQLEVRKMQELNDLKTRFFANISHEFRTPLTLIQGPVNDLLDQTSSEKIKNSLGVVQRNSARLKRLIDQLFEISKLEAKKLTINEQEHELWGFLRAICSSFTSMAANKGIAYVVNVPSGAINALYDEEKMEMIIYNIVSNAFKFTPSDGVITIRASVDQRDKSNNLNIIVKDTGIGFNETEKSKIFDRFYRVDSQSKIDGAGIGLSLTKELVELMQGTITVRSEEGKGTSFTVELPLKITTQTSTQTKKESVEIDNLSRTTDVEKNLVNAKKNRILMVEDNEDLRAYIKAILYNDFDVLEAENGIQGLTIAQEEIPDLILSDFMMPAMEGDEFCRRIKSDERTAHIPFIMLTAKASKEDKISGLELGADDYLFKPFDKKELRIKIANILKRREQLQKKLTQEFMLSAKEENLVSHDDRFLFKLKKLVTANLGEANLNVKFLSEEMGLSRVQLYRKLNALLGLSATDFIRKLRIQRAAELLNANWGTVSEVAYEVGFNNLSYFSKCFKEVYRQTPSSYLK